MVDFNPENSFISDGQSYAGVTIQEKDIQNISTRDLEDFKSPKDYLEISTEGQFCKGNIIKVERGSLYNFDYYRISGTQGDKKTGTYYLCCSPINTEYRPIKIKIKSIPSHPSIIVSDGYYLDGNEEFMIIGDVYIASDIALSRLFDDINVRDVMATMI